MAQKKNFQLKIFSLKKLLDDLLPPRFCFFQKPSSFLGKKRICEPNLNISRLMLIVYWPRMRLKSAFLQQS
jgi:hypothetical protein